VVAELLRGRTFASYTFKQYPVPYIGTPSLFGLLDLVLPPEVSGKIVLSLCLILFISNDLATLYSKLRSANSRTEFCEIYETYRRQSWDSPHRTGLDILLTNQASAPRLPYYFYLYDKAEPPINQISILDYNGHGDKEDLCSPW
jgi:hypothetical protein